MKSILTLLITIWFIPAALGQQSPKADDALLLEYYQNQRFADAADYLKKTYPEPVTDAKILASLAYSSQMAGRLPDAEGYYQRIYSSDTTNTAVIFSLGNIMVRRGDNVKALFYYKKLLLKDSTNFSVYKQMARMSQNSGKPGDALKYYQKANKINPQEPDVAFDLSAYYINSKQYNQADTIVTAALKADTGNLLLLESKAQVDYHLEKYAETVSECTKLIGYGDAQSQVINTLGTSYYKLKDYKNCIKTFNLLEQANMATEISYYCTAMSYKALDDQ
jgi:tetratricopeptide (TPR) repeat protein